MTIADHIARFEPAALRGVLTAHYVRGLSPAQVENELRRALKKLGRPTDVNFGRELFALLKEFEGLYLEAGDYDEPKVAAMETEKTPPLRPGEIRLANGLTFQVD